MNTPITTLYGLPNCDTVKRARRWLAAHGVEHAFHDFKRQGVPSDHLARWLDAAGRDRLVNRQGTTWRKLDETVRAGVVNDATATHLMQDQPSVIKRPVVEWAGGSVTVGFDEAAWAAMLAGRR